MESAAPPGGVMLRTPSGVNCGGQNLSAFVLDHVVEKAALGPPCLLLGRCDPLELVELLAASATVLLSEIGAGTDQFEVCVSTVSAPLRSRICRSWGRRRCALR